MTTRTDFTQPQAGLLGEARTMKAFGRRVTLAAADLVTGNIVEAFVVPAGFTVTGILAVASDMDSGSALTLSVGDSGSGTRFLSASTIGQTGATTSTLATTGVLYAYTADTKILVTCTLQGSSSVAGTLDLYLTGFVAG
jgi:hypothetical protein